jgi:hypothetical protein
MKLPNPPQSYDAMLESQRNRMLEQSDGQNYKKNQDLYVTPGQRLILYNPSGVAYEVYINASNALAIRLA